jgi:hypothetical protein
MNGGSEPERMLLIPLGQHQHQPPCVLTLWHLKYLGELSKQTMMTLIGE